MKERSAHLSQLIFQSKFVLLISLTAVSLYAFYATLRFSGDKLYNQYYYVMPIIAPFVIFLIERLERFGQIAIIPRLIDALIVITAMWRVIGDVPFISGHPLFLAYALLTGYSRLSRMTALIVLLEVTYLKIFVWNDSITLLSGIILGGLAALIRKLFQTA